MRSQPGAGIVFDTALSRIDDALALALLYGLDGRHTVRVVAITVDRASLPAAVFCDLVSRFYAGTVSGAIGAGGRTLPVGLAPDSRVKGDLPMFTLPLAKKNATGQPVYPTDIHDADDTAEPLALIRNALTAQMDHNAVVVLSGPATSLANLLDVGGAKELIARKVKLLAIAGGGFPEGQADANLAADLPAARRLFAEWPTPIVIAGQEVGAALLFPAASIEKDFAWAPAHPVADAYRANQAMPYDAPTTAMAAVLYASNPESNYFKLSDAGTVSVLDDGRTRFTRSASGTHRYVIVDAAEKDRVVKTYTDVSSAKPVAPPPRRPRVDVVKEQQPQKKD